MKEILVINGIPESHKHIDERPLIDSLTDTIDHKYYYFSLRDMNINYCTGCWSCWWKTPGKCSIHDDYEEILKLIPHVTDILVITPILVGYESSLSKKFKDRIIPTALPYIRIHKGEMHHYPRYEHLPDYSVIALTDKNTSKADEALVKETYERVALNFNSSLKLFKTTTALGGIKDVISHI